MQVVEQRCESNRVFFEHELERRGRGERGGNIPLAVISSVKRTVY